MDLLALAILCGPLVNPATTLRVIEVESQGRAYVIHDNSTGLSIDARSAARAENIATALIKAGHRIDVGLMQINYEVWLKPTQVSLQGAFDPCTNVGLGTTILSANYARTISEFGLPTNALSRALSLYNSGSESRSLKYADQVMNSVPSRSISSEKKSVPKTGAVSWWCSFFHCSPLPNLPAASLK